METKVKITYIDTTNKVMAKIVNLNGWYDLAYKLSTLNILDTQVIRIERVLVASSDNTEEIL